MVIVAAPRPVGPQTSLNSVFCCIGPVPMPVALPVGVEETFLGKPGRTGLLERVQEADRLVPLQKSVEALPLRTEGGSPWKSSTRGPLPFS